MEPIFRPAGKPDLEQILAMMRQLYELDGYPLHETRARQALAGLLDNPAFGRAWLVEVEGQVVGYMFLTLGYSLEFGGRDAFVDELYIQASHRRHGLGTKALEFAVETCRVLGVQALHLEVERANSAAQSVYRRFGFKDHDRYLMTKWVLD